MATYYEKIKRDTVPIFYICLVSKKTQTLIENHLFLLFAVVVIIGVLALQVLVKLHMFSVPSSQFISKQNSHLSKTNVNTVETLQIKILYTLNLHSAVF